MNIDDMKPRIKSMLAGRGTQIEWIAPDDEQEYRFDIPLWRGKMVIFGDNGLDFMDPPSNLRSVIDVVIQVAHILYVSTGSSEECIATIRSDTLYFSPSWERR